MGSEERVSIRLLIAEAKQQQDIGRGIARIDSDTIEALGVTVGGDIEIHGKSVIPAWVWPAYPEDQGLGLIRIDGFIRKNCGVSLNTYVIVRKAQVVNATFIELAPLDIRISVDLDFMRFVKDRMIGRPVIQGETIIIMMLGHSVPFKVVTTKPSGIVKISRSTEVNVLSDPISATIGSSKVTSRGQITIPKDIRDKYRIRPGDTIQFLEENGKLFLRKQKHRRSS